MRENNSIISQKEIDFYKRENKKSPPSPDISKMQMVKIDERTSIYIPMDASADEARERYEQYLNNRK